MKLTSHVTVSLLLASFVERGLRSNSNDRKLNACDMSNVNGCICDESGLREAIETASVDPVNPTLIKMCRSSRVVLSSAIDVSNKAIEIQCLTNVQFIFSSDCEIDGNGNRIFKGDRAKLSVKNMLFTNASSQNNASRDGGAFRLKHSVLEVDSCRFENNSAPKGAGGAISMTGGRADIMVSTFHDNDAENGGAVAFSSTSVTITACDFDQNTALAAGALIVRGGTVIIDNTEFKNNKAKTVVRILSTKIFQIVLPVTI